MSQASHKKTTRFGLVFLIAFTIQSTINAEVHRGDLEATGDASVGDAGDSDSELYGKDTGTYVINTDLTTKGAKRGASTTKLQVIPQTPVNKVAARTTASTSLPTVGDRAKEQKNNIEIGRGTKKADPFKKTDAGEVNGAKCSMTKEIDPKTKTVKEFLITEDNTKVQVETAKDVNLADFKHPEQAVNVEEAWKVSIRALSVIDPQKVLYGSSLVPDPKKWFYYYANDKLKKFAGTGKKFNASAAAIPNVLVNISEKGECRVVGGGGGMGKSPTAKKAEQQGQL